MAAKKQEVKKMTKAEQMAATIRGVSDELKPIIGAGELQLFVKTTTVSDFLSKLATLEALTQKHGDEYKNERSLALGFMKIMRRYSSWRFIGNGLNA